uniref:Uncharacterized protein n=1 Tax=Globodera rostochiensis TaxID=31243 RepID=A0A914H4Q3_GLORO
MLWFGKRIGRSFAGIPSIRPPGMGFACGEFRPSDRRGWDSPAEFISPILSELALANSILARPSNLLPVITRCLGISLETETHQSLVRLCPLNEERPTGKQPKATKNRLTH